MFVLLFVEGVVGKILGGLATGGGSGSYTFDCQVAPLPESGTISYDVSVTDELLWRPESIDVSAELDRFEEFASPLKLLCALSARRCEVAVFVSFLKLFSRGMLGGFLLSVAWAKEKYNILYINHTYH